MDPIDQYISQFPAPVQAVLAKVRQLVLANAPGAEELMAYGMPGYKTHRKPLVYFAAYPHHLGFYATPTGHAAFQAELAHYKQGKGSVQFPLDQPIPYELIERIVKFRVAENETQAKK
jgi:uncharacterized protein YdhG (YjbR/CyaY superfamily)